MAATEAIRPILWAQLEISQACLSLYIQPEVIIRIALGLSLASGGR